MTDYKHEKSVHRLRDPDIIVPKIINLFNPKSVVDIGCGLGTFLQVCKKCGVSDILGIDGAWVNKKLLYENIDSNEFLEWNLGTELILHKKYDLVINLEVAEHLSPEKAPILVENLVNAGNLILFSAAIPHQGGQNHVNEQWLDYWEKLFFQHNFVMYDVIRPLFWDIPELLWWYKQNMVLFAPKELYLPADLKPVPMNNIVHYEHFIEKSTMLEKYQKERKSPLSNFKNLIVSILGYDSMIKIKRKYLKGDQ